MFQYIHAEVYARKACTNPKNKTKSCIDDIIGEVIRVLAMSARRSNVKVEPPCVARSARTPGSIVTSSTTNDSKESAPSSHAPHGEHARKRGHADFVGCSCLRQRATDRLRPRASDGLQSEASSVGAGGNPRKLVQGAAPGRGYIKENNQGVSR